MLVNYVNHMGDDLMVVNAARVSFDKASDWEGEELTLKDADRKLIRYLARHGHWTPFAHPTITVRVKAPIFVARQLFKHKVGMTENEVSRRYVDDEPEFFVPDVWRGRPTNGTKQGSSGVPNISQNACEHYAWAAHSRCLEIYDELLKSNVAPEQARMVLPQSMYTEWYWTGSLAAFARIYGLRSDPHAQKESQEVATMIDEIIRPLFPVSWEALCETR